MSGKVILVGAGPHDPKLLTIAAIEELAKAEVVVYDRLVSDDIMNLIPDEVERIYVGKNAGRHPVKQEEINQILLEQAQAGKRVVRLKGGDSFLFGRGGEELELIKEQGIAYKVVPGISSSLSVPTYAGIPVTHRDYCSSVHIITGHKKEDQTLDLDYDALVRLKGTLIFMMSVKSSPMIMEGLITAGMSEDMPVAIIENGTSPMQRKVVTTTGGLKEDIVKHAVKSPAIVMVGKVCALEFDWFMNGPLFGKKILVTRPKKHADKMADALREAGAMVTIASTIETKAIKVMVPDLQQYSTMIFTSGNGVRAFFEALYQTGQDVRAIAHMKFATVGTQTRKELLSFGIASDFLPSVFEGDVLAKEMLEEGFLSLDDKTLIIRGSLSAELMQERLKAAEILFDELICYETNYVKHDAIELSEYEVVTFTSASAVTSFVESYDYYQHLTAYCIGEMTATEARKYGFEVRVSKEATINSMVECMIETM
ncbi:MAG: uroporphyrinogen-III C-methyltransferase [Lachnospiraceae bacterium]